jgi:hypothetical protein
MSSNEKAEQRAPQRNRVPQNAACRLQTKPTLCANSCRTADSHLFDAQCRLADAVLLQ